MKKCILALMVVLGAACTSFAQCHTVSGGFSAGYGNFAAPTFSGGGCNTVAAPVVQYQQSYAVQPVQAVQVVRSYAVQPVQVVRQVQVVQQHQVYSQGFTQFQQQGFRQQRFQGGGGFGGGRGGLFGATQQGFASGGILGGLERLTGLGDGSGQVGTGAILGVLGARANLFGLGGRR